MGRTFLAAAAVLLAASCLCPPALAAGREPPPAPQVTAPGPVQGQTGWVTRGGRRYYYKNGQMLKGGWLTVDGRQYYLAADGHMMSYGWLTVGGKRYYLARDGHVMKRGFLTYGGRKYYLALDGHMMKGGWLTVNGQRYYLGSDGAALTGWHAIGGQMYRFDESGKRTVSAGPAERSPDWIGSLREARTTDELMVVAATGTQADVSLHIRDGGGTWYRVLDVRGTVGANGLGKQREGDKRTPVGVYHFTDAFGIRPDPGSVIPYVQVDDSHWWVGDSSSAWYNRFVSDREVVRDWAGGTSEHIVTFGHVYNYVLAFDFNKELTPGAGSAIFLHCLRSPGSPTGGCVAIPEESMVQVLRTVDKTCSVIIDTPANVRNY